MCSEGVQLPVLKEYSSVIDNSLNVERNVPKEAGNPEFPIFTPQIYPQNWVKIVSRRESKNSKVNLRR
jgi:hypothetical protein